MPEGRGFREPPCGSVRGSFRPRHGACSWPRSHRGHAPIHSRHTSTALLASRRSQWDRTGSHMPSRSWWRTGKELRGIADRLQCTCRRAGHEAARVQHWQRSSQRFLLSLYGHLSTTRWSGIRPPNGERVHGSGLSADWQGVLAGVLLISFAVPVVLAPGAVRSAPIHADGECSPQ